MPHAVILGATRLPEIPHAPLAREGGTIHKVAETLTGPAGLVLKSLVIDAGQSTHFLVRIERRPDGMVVRLDDHMPVERTPVVFDHLALVATLVLAANPSATLGATNLADRIERARSAPAQKPS